MSIDVKKDKKLVRIWLPKSESGYKPSVFMKVVFDAYKRMGYAIAIYFSGTADLYEYTLALLLWNRRRMVEREDGIPNFKNRRNGTLT